MMKEEKLDTLSLGGLQGIGQNIQRKVVHKKTNSSYFLNLFQNIFETKTKEPLVDLHGGLNDHSEPQTLNKIRGIVETHEENKLSQPSSDHDIHVSGKLDKLVYMDNYDHFEHDRIEFYNLVCAMKQNALQLSEEKDVKIKERYEWAIKENLKKLTVLKDVLVIKYKDLKAHLGPWKGIDLNATKGLIETRRKKILESQIEYDYIQNKCAQMV
jgi:hypothetical protein